MIITGQRWVGYVLTASLALNLFLVGLIVTRLIVGQHAPAPVDLKNTLTIAVQPVTPLLPQPARKFLVEAMDPQRKTVQAAFKRQNDARQIVARALATEPYDPKALKAALDEVHDAQTLVQQLVSTALAEAAPNLQPEDRLQLAPMFQNPGQGWRQSQPNPEEPRTFQLRPDK